MLWVGITSFTLRGMDQFVNDYLCICVEEMGMYHVIVLDVLYE